MEKIGGLVLSEIMIENFYIEGVTKQVEYNPRIFQFFSLILNFFDYF